MANEYMGKNAKERICYWAQLLLLPVYGLSFITPRDKNIWLFGSTFGRRFTDNPRYLYMYVNHFSKVRFGEKAGKKNAAASATLEEKLEKIRPIWISHNKEVIRDLNEAGFEAYYYHSFKGIFYALRAGFYIFDNYSKDINFWQSGGATKVNLWHGTGNKPSNAQNTFDKVRHPGNAWEKFKTFPRRLSDEKPSHYILEVDAGIGMANIFRVDPSHIIHGGGFPRNDAMLSIANKTEKRLYFYKHITPLEKTLAGRLEELSKDNKIVAYLPTFSKSESMLFEVIDLNKMNEYFRDHHYIFVAKPHPKSKIKAEFEKLDCSNIISVPSDVDVYTFIPYADMLVTDYSSIYTDYLLLDRPVVAFQFDKEKYVNDSRGFMVNQDEYMPERVATTGDELVEAITGVFADDQSRELRKRTRDRKFECNDDRSCDRITEAILKIRK